MKTQITRARTEIARNISKAIMYRWRCGEISKKEAIKQYEELPALKGFQIPRSLREESDDLYGELEEEELSEKRKKKRKKKKSGKKDACYHKVKSRYKVWPSAYGSGALVKCRKVGAKNWGNSKKEQLQTMVEDELAQVLQERKENSIEDIIYYTLFEVLNEKKNLDEDLRKWFGRKGAPGKKKGWVDCNTCRKDKKTGRKKCSACGRSSGEKRSKYPSCRPTPGACGKRGNWGKKSKKGKKG